MDHVYQSSVSTVSTPAPVPGSSGHVQSEPPLPSYTPTTPGPYWYWHKTESIRNVILAAGLVPDPQNLHQLRDAIALIANPPPPPPPPVDPYFAHVALLLHGEGSPGSTSIVDSSSNHIAMNTHGTVTIDTSQGEFSGGSMDFPSGGGNWLWTQSELLGFNSRDFTVEGWVKIPNLASSDGQSIFCVRNEVIEADGQTTLFVHADGTVEFYSGDGFGNNPVGFSAPAASWPADEWVFFSLTQVYTGPIAGILYLHLNGVLVASHTGRISTAYPVGINIGNYGYQSADQDFIGKIQEYRVTLNIARYTADNYSVPMARFPNS